MSDRKLGLAIQGLKFKAAALPAERMRTLAAAELQQVKWSNTGEERAINILRELHAAEEELVGRAAVMTDGKAGAIDHVYLDEVHGLRISIGGHDGEWPISTVRFIQSRPAAHSKFAAEGSAARLNTRTAVRQRD
jgi:hypothetical protein